MPRRKKLSEAFEEELFHVVGAHDYCYGWSKRFFKQAELVLLAYLGLLPHTGEEVETHYLWLNRANKQDTPEDLLLLQEFEPVLRLKMEMESLMAWFEKTTGWRTTGGRTPDEVEAELRRRGEEHLLLELNEAIEKWQRATELSKEADRQKPDDYLIEYDREMYERVPPEHNTQGLIFNEKPLNDIFDTWGKPDAAPSEGQFNDLLERLDRFEPLPLSAYCESVSRGLDVRCVRGRPVPVVRFGWLHRFTVHLDYYDGVAEKLYQSPQASHARIQRNDVLLMGKTVNPKTDLAIYTTDDPALASDYITILRPNAECNPYFLMLYLASPVGQAFCQRARVKVDYAMEIADDAIRRFLVPTLPTDLQKRLGNTMARSVSLVQEAEALFARSEWARAIAHSKGEAEGWKYLEKFPKAPSPWRGV